MDRFRSDFFSGYLGFGFRSRISGSRFRVCKVLAVLISMTMLKRNKENSSRILLEKEQFRSLPKTVWQTSQRKIPKEWEWNAEEMKIRMLLFNRAN